MIDRSHVLTVIFLVLIVLIALPVSAFARAEGLVAIVPWWVSAFAERFIISLKVVSGLVAVLSFGGMIYVVLMTTQLHNNPLPEKIVHDETPLVIEPFIHEEWTHLKEKLQEASDEDAAYLVIEADTIVDRVLKSRGILGETMGDRLQELKFANFKNLNALRSAHKMRNQIAHEGAKTVHYSDAVYALEQYEKALQELGVI